MHITITGATGFIGRHLVKLLSDSDHDLLCVGRNPKMLSHLKAQYGVQCLCVDIDNDCDTWFECIGTPEVIIHLAWGDLDNYKSLTHLHHHLPRHMNFLEKLVNSGIQKLVVSGTGFEYGLQSGSLQETDFTNPVTPYGVAKDTLQKYLSFLQSKSNFSLIWLRYFYMHGDDQPKRSFLSQLEHAIEQRQPVFNMSFGEQLRDYLPVEDVALLTATLACDERASGIYNVCSGNPISIRRLAEQKIDEHKSDISLKLGHYPYPEYEPMAFWGDRTKLDNFLKKQAQQ
jgi:dTDP-6-deoxy-L-talose 4-dehydrogenase (NAD+)